MLNDGVFSEWNGHSPTTRRPTRLRARCSLASATRSVASRTRATSSSRMPIDPLSLAVPWRPSLWPDQPFGLPAGRRAQVDPFEVEAAERVERGRGRLGHANVPGPLDPVEHREHERAHLLRRTITDDVADLGGQIGGLEDPRPDRVL